MANMLALNTVYNHYLTTYARGSISKYDTHKKSELRSVYNSIVKLNKESPLYLLNNDQDSQAFAVGIKEGARELHNAIASLGGLNEDELLNKKVAHSSNENIVSAQYIGESSAENDVPSYDIEVRSLASPQINLGKYLPSDEMKLPTDTYSFDININNLSYEFQYNINENDTNKTVQEKLARLINGADIGVNAAVDEDPADHSSALKLTSSSTGITSGKDQIFTISDTHSSKTAGSVDYFGINDTTRFPANSDFVINGVERNTTSNHFTLEKTFELTLNGISPTEGETANIALKNDTESLGENVNQLIGGYNSFLEKASANQTDTSKNARLVSEMKNIASLYKNGFSALGLHVSDNGSIQMDKTAYQQALESGSVKSSLAPLKDFANSVLRKSDQISINPMQYVDKTVVAYKNPGKNFATPYITSAYSGMMFNSYC